MNRRSRRQISPFCARPLPLENGYVAVWIDVPAGTRLPSAGQSDVPAFREGQRRSPTRDKLRVGPILGALRRQKLRSPLSYIGAICNGSTRRKSRSAQRLAAPQQRLSGSLSAAYSLARISMDANPAKARTA